LALPALKRKVRKIGDSLVINLPVEITDIVKLKAGMFLFIDLDGEKIIMKKEGS
jgi:antitoxin component of MazEF toxin-antitoxin module